MKKITRENLNTKKIMKKIIEFGKTEQGALDQAKNCLDEAEAFALMGDNHKGYGMPVGGVAVYKNKISPAGVGFDIACGNKAVKLDITIDDIDCRLEEIADNIWDRISFGVGQKNKEKVGHDLFHEMIWETSPFLKSSDGLLKKAKSQLGTIGSGNHYVDVFVGEDGHIWVGVHFGSRGLGHTIASHFMELAGDNLNIMDETPSLLDTNSPEGQDYIDCMNLAGRYAYAGRDWVCETVAEIIGGSIIDEVHNHHNFAWPETHNGQDYWVVRKGATPAFPNQRGFVGSTMEDTSVILKGIDSERSREAFYSTVHGAGRVMSRTKATGKKRYKKRYACNNRDCQGFVPYRQLKAEERRPVCPVCESDTRKWKGIVQISEGEVDFKAVQERVKGKGIILRGAGADESKEVYKNLDEVLELHEGTVEILHRLTPLIVCMAGANEFDPYKD